MFIQHSDASEHSSNIQMLQNIHPTFRRFSIYINSYVAFIGSCILSYCLHPHTACIVGHTYQPNTGQESCNSVPLLCCKMPLARLGIFCHRFLMPRRHHPQNATNVAALWCRNAQWFPTRYVMVSCLFMQCESSVHV